MEITITYIRLRHWWQFFPLTKNAMYILRQCKNSKGFKGMKNTGFGLDHYTMSRWEKAEDRQDFYKKGAHLEAMKKGGVLSSEIRTYTFSGENFPAWKEAKRLVQEQGKSIRYPS